MEPSPVAYGTAVVAVRTATDIIVGADGKINYAVLAGNAQTTCKIFQVGRVFVVNAGMIVSAKFGYDAQEVATTAIQQGGSILEMIDRYEDLVGQPLLEAAADFHDKNPDLYKRMTGDGETLCTAFFGIEDDVPTLIHTQFEVMFSSGDAANKLKVGPPRTVGLGHYLAWGHTRPLKEFLDRNPGYFGKAGDVNAIRNLIQLAIDDRPDKVGSPIAIICVNKAGAEWVGPSGCCPPITSY